MKVEVKKLDASIEIKTNGMELEVRDTKGSFLGDLIITKTKLEWCRGRTRRGNGETIDWEEFISFMENR